MSAIAFAAGFLGAVVGGGVATWQSGAPFWKGAVLILASCIAWAVVMAGVQAVLDFKSVLFGLIFAFVSFFATVGLIGGRWGMKLSSRQMGVVLIGSIFFGLVFAVVTNYIYVDSVV